MTKADIPTPSVELAPFHPSLAHLNPAARRSSPSSPAAEGNTRPWSRTRNTDPVVMPWPPDASDAVPFVHRILCGLTTLPALY